jgi:tRNA threonylcarbamoyladenosine biosynthesis protein TsaE
VTVVEWGQGLVEDLAADRLEVVITRRQGTVPGPDGDPDPVGVGDGTDEDEPRLVTLTGVGPRWAVGALAELV